MTEPVSLAEAKAQVRVSDPSEDSLLNGLIAAARAFVEDLTGVILMQRQMVEVSDDFGPWGGTCDLRAWPIVSIDAVSYLDRSNVGQTLPSISYVANLDARPVRISMARGAMWPWTEFASDTVSITVTAGFSDAAVPPPLKQAILLLIGHWYDNRSAVEAGSRAAAVELPFAVDMLCNRWRRRVL